MNLLKCKVCGFEFQPREDMSYIARDDGVTGLAAALGNHSENKTYDAFDCPHCGCQYIAQERKKLWVPPEISYGSDEASSTPDETQLPESEHKRLIVLQRDDTHYEKFTLDSLENKVVLVSNEYSDIVDVLTTMQRLIDENGRVTVNNLLAMLEFSRFLDPVYGEVGWLELPSPAPIFPTAKGWMFRFPPFENLIRRVSKSDNAENKKGND